MRKKIIVSLMSILVLLSLSLFLIGAGATEVTYIRCWDLFTGGDGEFFDPMVDEFNATHADIQVYGPRIKHADYYIKLMTAMAAKNAPDVCIMHQSSFPEYIPRNVLYPIEDVVKEVKIDLNDYIEAPLAACYSGGHLYALPLDVHPLIFYYNIDLMKAAGLVDESGKVMLPKSAEEFINFARQIQEKTDQWGVDIENTTSVYPASTLSRLFFSLLAQQGGTMLTPDIKKANFNNEKGVKALKLLVDLTLTYKVNPPNMDYDAGCTLFKLGKAGMHFNGVWALGSYAQAKDLNMGCAPVPVLYAKGAAWSGSHTFVFPIQKEKNMEKLRAGVIFAAWMSEHGEMWAKAGHCPVRENVLEKPEFKALPYRADYAAAAESAWAPPGTPRWGEIYKTCSDYFEAAVAGKWSVEETLDRLEDEVNSILAR